MDFSSSARLFSYDLHWQKKTICGGFSRTDSSTGSACLLSKYLSLTVLTSGNIHLELTERSKFVNRQTACVLDSLRDFESDGLGRGRYASSRDLSSLVSLRSSFHVVTFPNRSCAPLSS